MKTVEVIVEHAGNNLSAYIEGAPVITVGNDVKEIEKNMKEAVELYLDSCNEMNIAPVKVLQGEFHLEVQDRCCHLYQLLQQYLYQGCFEPDNWNQ